MVKGRLLLCKKVVILVSGRGSNMLNIIKAVNSRIIDININAVISNKKEPEAFSKAKYYNIPVKSFGNNIKLFEKRLLEYINKNNIDFILLAGFMRILSKDFVNKMKDRILNIHPSYLPDFPGLDAQRKAWDKGVLYTGVTVHLVDSGMDTGKIILQEKHFINYTLGFEEFKNELLKLEHTVYIEAIKLYLIKYT